MTSYPFRTALVTGASSGIGRSMAELLSAAGVQTIGVARRSERLDEIAADHDSFESMVADLNDADDLGRVADRIGDDRIDLVVNNAGFGTSGSFADLDRERLDREVGLNVSALTHLSHAALAAMVPRGAGWLLNVSSVVSFQPAPKLAVYAATKAYVTSLSESLHEEVKGRGVHVTALCPGLTRTEFASVSNADSYNDQYPEWAFAEAEDVAAAGLRDVISNKALSIPGAVNKTLVTGSELMPRSIRRRLASLVQR